MRYNLAISVAALILAMGALSQAQDGTVRNILAQEFPMLSGRVEFFEQRINSPNARLRVEALREVGYFRTQADDQTTRFLRRMMHDPEASVRGQAIRLLYDLWMATEPRELPTTFTGYHDGQLINLENPKQVKELIEQCSLTDTGPGPGYAAYVLGLVKCKDAAPSLARLAEHPNVFVRYTAGRSLAEIGDPVGATILESIAHAELAMYARSTDAIAAQQPATARQPFYAMVASTALMKVAGREKAGIDHLIELLGFLEKSDDPNDQARVSRVQRLLAGVAGRWFDQANEARAWFTQKYK